MTTTPDIYTNVHKGLRRALFASCLALGRASDAEETAEARRLLGEVLHFVRHHGENEDVLLLPLLQRRAPEIALRMEEAHRHIDDALAALEARVADAAVEDLHHRLASFIALYLEHMREEEQELDERIRAVLTAEEMAGVGRGSVERTAPADQRMMIGWMLPALPRPQAEAYLKKLPPSLAEELSRTLDSAGP